MNKSVEVCNNVDAFIKKQTVVPLGPSITWLVCKFAESLAVKICITVAVSVACETKYVATLSSSINEAFSWFLSPLINGLSYFYKNFVLLNFLITSKLF